MSRRKRNRPITVYLVRHGETEWNVAGRVQGQKDSPLTLKGRKQAEKLSEDLSEIEFEAVFSSDLGRTRETAKLITGGKYPVIANKLLRERDFGKHEGKLASEYRKEFADKYNLWPGLSLIEKYNLKFDSDVESDGEMTNRLANFLSALPDKYSGKKILVVTHGGVIRCYLSYVVFRGEKFLPAGSVENTAVVTIEYGEKVKLLNMAGIVGEIENF